MNLRIDHRIGVADIKFFNSFSLNLKYDSMASTFAFNFYFDPRNKVHAELACVSHFHEAIVEHNGERLITGYILSEAFNRGSVDEMVQVGGYSKPGVLEDCEIPTSLYPLQSDGLSIREIAQKLIAPFKLAMVVDGSVAAKMDEAIETSTAKEGQNIKSYLTELCSQRDILISHDAFGRLLFTKARTNLKPIMHVEDGVIGTSMSLSFNGQGIHSHITVVKEPDDTGGNSGEVTIQNPYCPIVYRPKVIALSSGNDITIEQAAQNALASELKNITLTVNTDRWDVGGKLIRPNNLITVTSPKLFLYKKSTWFIEEVDLIGDAEKTTAVLKCVPPEVYNGATPRNVFIDPHLNLPRF